MILKLYTSNHVYMNRQKLKPTTIMKLRVICLQFINILLNILLFNEKH